MKAENLILLGAVGIALYFYLKKSGLLDSIGGGAGGGSTNTPLIDQLLSELKTDHYFTPGGVGAYGGSYVAPATTRDAVVQALQSGATVYSHKMGLTGAQGQRKTSWISIPQTGKLAASLAVTSQQYQIAPRIYKGKKVM
jgi:hypothetical protein